MSQFMSHVEYLSKEIGPRPAGTEEERQASLYVTEQFQKEAGFAAAIEDFASSSDLGAGLAVLAGVTVAATVLAMIFPVLVIPAFVLATIAAIAYSLEHFDHPTISRVLSRGASQNVVAKYQPGQGSRQDASGRRSARSRKIVLVAHYDTGRVTPALVMRVESLGLPVALVCVGGMIAAAFFLLLRIFVGPSGGMGLLVLNVLTILAVVVCLLPIVKALLMRSAPYNEGAINNASGTAALLEVARRIARGSVSEADLVEMSGDVSIHGEAAAREQGLVPEGALLEYEAGQLEPPSEIGERSEEDRLLSAKAAIAALTGRPVERRVFGSVAENLVSSRADELPPESVFSDLPSLDSSNFEAAPSELLDLSAGDDGESTSQSAAEPEEEAAEGFENAPSWFVAAQRNAKRTERYNADEPPRIRRSRYTEAIENAERERQVLEEELRAAEQEKRDAELRAREEEARAALAAKAAQPEEAESRDGEIDSGAEAAEAETGLSDATAAGSQPLSLPAVQGPSGTVAMASPVPASEVAAEARALESGADGSSSEAKGRMAALPSIEAPSPAEPTHSGPESTKSPSRSGILRNLRANVPSLSGAIFGKKAADAPKGESSTEQDRASALRSVEAIADPGAPAANVGADSLYQRHVEPGSLESGLQQSAAPSPQAAQHANARDAQRSVEPDLAPPSSAEDSPSAAAPHRSVDVPRSRSGNLLNRFRKGNDEALSDTPQHWLDVDDDFEARDVGRARGSWESFRDDQYDDDDSFGDFGSGDEDRPNRRWQGGAYSSRVQVGYANTEAEAVAEASLSGPILSHAPDRVLNEEIEQIYHFRNPFFNTEIWFVAVGADGEGHDGARAFIDEHRDELRGSMIVEIESLGSGALAVASEEGSVRKVQASSRVKRFTRGATAATGVAVDEVSLVGTDSISSTMQKAGFQAMHLFGAEDGRPALKGSADDVLENVDEALLDEHINFIFELLKD